MAEQQIVRIEKPAFNMATAYLIRVNDILNRIANYSISGRYDLLYNSLIALFREISPYIEKAEQDNIEKKFNKVVGYYNSQKSYTINAF